MYNMSTKDSEFEVFAKSVNQNFAPLLNKLNFQGEQIDPRLFIFSKENLQVKIYLPECHGYDVTVTLSPVYTRIHYEKSERDLYWFGRFLNIGEFRTSRRTSLSQISELVKLNVEFLKKVLDALDLNRLNFWHELDNFINSVADEETSKYKF